MSGIWRKLADIVPWASGRRLAGRDLAGNKYYEMPNPAGGRPKRTVQYKQLEHISDYTSGRVRLPIQWTAWLSHTRPKPPTLQELQADFERQNRLSPMIAAIEEREKQERIRQGYVSADEADLPQIHSHLPDFNSNSLTGPGIRPTVTPHAKATIPPSLGGPSPSTLGNSGLTEQPGQLGPGQIGESSTQPSQMHTQNGDQPQHMRGDGRVQSGGGERAYEDTPEYNVPTSTSTGVAPPSEPVDPTQHSSKEDLRRLSEEDTRRRMAESKVQDPHRTPVPVQSVSGVGLKPRRRGAAA